MGALTCLRGTAQLSPMPWGKSGFRISVICTSGNIEEISKAIRSAAWWEELKWIEIPGSVRSVLIYLCRLLLR
jgi:hypothetical protein